jgi:hypothetical protein
MALAGTVGVSPQGGQSRFLLRQDSGQTPVSSREEIVGSVRWRGRDYASAKEPCHALWQERCFDGLAIRQRQTGMSVLLDVGGSDAEWSLIDLFSTTLALNRFFCTTVDATKQKRAGLIGGRGNRHGSGGTPLLRGPRQRHLTSNACREADDGCAGKMVTTRGVSRMRLAQGRVPRAESGTPGSRFTLRCCSLS